MWEDMSNLAFLNDVIDAAGDDNFSTTLVVLALAFLSLLLMLFSDKIALWKSERRERTKWLYWNRR
jgi:hypothetical protein